MPVQNDGLRLLRHLSDLRFEEELRGYSKSQVDRVLQKLAPMAEEIETLQSRLSEAETRAASAEARLIDRPADSQPPAAPQTADPVAARADVALPATPADFDETLRKTLLLAQRTADETVKEAYDEADRVKNNAHGEADLLLAKAKNEAEQIQNEAAAQQTTMLGETEAERSRLLNEARDNADKLKAEFELALNEAEGAERAELLEQIGDLQTLRSALTNDIEQLEDHLESRRAVIRQALSDLTAVVDGTGPLPAAEAPTLSDVEEIETNDVTPIELVVEGLSGAEAINEGDTGNTLTESDQGDEPDDGGSAFSATGFEPSTSAEDGYQADSAGFEAEGSEADGTDGEDADAADGGFETYDPGSVEEIGFLDQSQFGNDGEGGGEATASYAIADGDDTGVVVVNNDDDGYGEDGRGEEVVVPGSDLGSESDSTFAGPAPDAGGPPTQEFSFAELGVAEVAATHTDPWASEQPARPAWVETVSGTSDSQPPAPAIQDPFLNELRRATSEESVGSDEALERFLDGDGEDDDDRKTWFGRRR